MKIYKIEIINKAKISLYLNIIQPETLQETLDIQQSELPNNIDGIINFPLPGEVCIHPYEFQNVIRLTFDWLSINWQGKILAIDKNVKPEQNIKLHPDSVSVIILKQGLSNIYNLSVGNTIIHEKFHFNR